MTCRASPLLHPPSAPFGVPGGLAHPRPHSVPRGSCCLRSRRPVLRQQAARRKREAHLPVQVSLVPALAKERMREGVLLAFLVLLWIQTVEPKLAARAQVRGASRPL